MAKTRIKDHTLTVPLLTEKEEEEKKQDTGIGVSGGPSPIGSSLVPTSKSEENLLAIIKQSSFQAIDGDEEKNKKAHARLYTLYYIHGLLGLLGEVPYTYFTYAMGVDGLRQTSTTLLGYSPPSIALKMASAALSGLSFIGNITTFSPSSEAADAVQAAESNPDQSLLNIMKGHKLLSAAMFIHFLAGGYADVDQIDSFLEETLGPIGKWGVIITLLYTAVSYYTLFCAKDAVKGKLAYSKADYESPLKKAIKAIRRGHYKEALTALITSMQTFVTVHYRAASFAYLGYELAIQNGLMGTTRILDMDLAWGGYAAAALSYAATYPVASYTRGPAIEKRYYNSDLEATDINSVSQEYSQRSRGEIVRDELSYLLLSPGIFLAIPAAYYVFIGINSLTQDYLGVLPAEIASYLASSTAFVGTQLLFRVPTQAAHLISLAEEKRTLRLLEEKGGEQRKPIPNMAATALAYSSNWADQLMRAITFVPQIIILAGLSQEDPDFGVVLLAFCLSCFIAKGNFDYQWRKSEDALPQMYTIFARSAPVPCITRLGDDENPYGQINYTSLSEVGGHGSINNSDGDSQPRRRNFSCNLL